MEKDILVLILAGAVAGGFINGLAGFGTSLFALGFFLSVLPPKEAVALVLLLSIVTSLQGLWIVRQAMVSQFPRLIRFLIPAIIGVPIGVQMLQYVDVSTLKIVIAGFLITYGGYFSVRKNLPRFEKPMRKVDMVVGFLGGILGGLASLSGALPTMWCSMRAWTKAETRGVLQPFNFLVLSISSVLLIFKDAYTATVLQYSLIVLPVAIVSAQIGLIIFKRVPDAMFQRLLIGLCFISGAMLMVREIF